MDTVSPQHWENKIFPYYCISTQVNELCVTLSCVIGISIHDTIQMNDIYLAIYLVTTQ